MLKIIIVIAVIFVGYIIFNIVSMMGVKSPVYEVTKKDGDIQIRQYQPMLIAEVIVTGDRRDAVRSGFRLLADYIFGNNTDANNQSEKIKMTSPVMQQASTKIDMTRPVMQQGVDANQWIVQFVMPKQFTLQTIPKPKNQKVTLKDIPKHSVVVIRFSGLPNKHSIAKHQQKLDAYIEKNKLKVTGPATYAYYDPPWTLPFLRRNEVMYTLQDN